MFNLDNLGQNLTISIFILYVVQVESLLSRLEGGEELENIIKEERRRERRKQIKDGAKTKKLKLLQKKVQIVGKTPLYKFIFIFATCFSEISFFVSNSPSFFPFFFFISSLFSNFPYCQFLKKENKETQTQKVQIMHGKSPGAWEPGSQRPDHLKVPTPSHSGRKDC